MATTASQQWPSALSEPQQIRQIESVLTDATWKCEIIRRLTTESEASEDPDFEHVQKVLRLTIVP